MNNARKPLGYQQLACLKAIERNGGFWPIRTSMGTPSQWRRMFKSLLRRGCIVRHPNLPDDYFKLIRKS